MPHSYSRLWLSRVSQRASRYMGATQARMPLSASASHPSYGYREVDQVVTPLLSSSASATRAGRRAGRCARGADQSRGPCEPGRRAAAAGREESGMTQGIETRLDGNTLVVRIPMRFQRRGGRKRIVAPDGSAIVPSSKPQPGGTLVKALARAWRWQRFLDEGRFGSARELAEAEWVSLFLYEPDSVPDAARSGHRRTDFERARGTTTG
jgi:hypothetical protein